MTQSGPDSNQPEGNERGGNETGPTVSLDKESATGNDDRYGSGQRLSPALIATLVAIPVMVLVGFIAFAAFQSDDDDDPAAEKYPTDPAVAGVCSKLLVALPTHFDGFGDKEIRGQNAVWPNDSGSGDDLSVRCGVSRPVDLNVSSALQVIAPKNSEPAQWFLADSIEGSAQSWVAVDHRPYVAIWLPTKAGAAPITDVTAVLTKVLPPAPLDFGAGTSPSAPAPTR